jgi:hypothetical protein
MAAEKPNMGEELMADELLLKLRVRLSPHSRQVHPARAPRSRIEGEAIVDLPPE